MDIEITPQAMAVAGITPEVWQRVCDLTGDGESARRYRGGWALRRLHAAEHDGDQEVSQ
ncbi:hypothetical protein [Micromonospora mirobrigensis]|uniref:Uncharacterized protein n=1 Tax=Micromonospora mirobrigensis TaxID=262898 RepID=A0A1C5AIF4_9ACTN|nr:hypothetical protein [Micromonospora mirobrigensis]SCF45018.1 hypothetical protein GA0070564_11123 [Micromonospora mirobrigensis]